MPGVPCLVAVSDSRKFCNLGITCYNVNTKTNIQKIIGLENSSFGQTLSSDDKNIFIGSPTWKSKGTVYSCPIKEIRNEENYYDEICKNIFENRSPGIGNSTGEQFGSSILLTDKHELIACGPRYKIHLDCVIKSGSKNEKECKTLDIRSNQTAEGVFSYALPGR